MAAQESGERPNSDDEDPERAQRQKRQRPLMICGHCDRVLTKSTYYRHKRSYFNPVSGTWLRTDASSQEPESASQVTPAPTAVTGNCHSLGTVLLSNSWL